MVLSINVSNGVPNGGNPLYFTIIPGNASTPRGNRQSSSTIAYIHPSLDTVKPGLTILTGHQAISLVWKSNCSCGASTATSVMFVPTPEINGTIGEPFTASVSKEVVVLLGALGVCLAFLNTIKGRG